MTTGSILFGIALLILVGLFVLQPLYVPETRRRSRPPNRGKILVRQKAAFLEEIRALDFDFDTGKIPPEVYEPQRAELVAAAAAVLQELDELVATAVTPVSDSTTDEIETAVAQLRAQTPPTAVPTNGRTNFCPQCGRAVTSSDKFCAGCGQPLAQPAAKPT
jgi:hypothetical protein